MKHIITLLVVGICASTLANAGGTVKLTNGGSYEAADGTKITCTGTIVKKDLACFCDHYNVLWIVRTVTKGDAVLASYGDDKAGCLEALKTRPDCN